MIGQFEGLVVVAVLFFIMEAAVYLFFKSSGRIKSDLAAIHLSFAVAVWVQNLAPLIVEGGIKTRSGSNLDAGSVMKFSIVISVVLMWMAVFAERSLRKKLDKSRE
ncbi:hypothetical protein [Alloalcanivorax gelatiniphagus]|uniref:Uncharacterized protein n=1 Tax=Alloalcanivorax gelatiniphagus TaxID=1194167 RepID=A0ABY2XMI2_9GAMM|nr:hypothetical protein [Alloalcanivorax gelatiniphagus]TMW13077.1 hypothetical protein FGS76_08410 [Alloalcanivorax gelatiniphagus]